VIVGAAIDLGRGVFPEQQGFPMMWVVAGSLMALGQVALWWAMRRTGFPRVRAGTCARGAGTTLRIGDWGTG
jgi:hypothetical protein